MSHGENILESSNQGQFGNSLTRKSFKISQNPLIKMGYLETNLATGKTRGALSFFPLLLENYNYGLFVLLYTHLELAGKSLYTKTGMDHPY